MAEETKMGRPPISQQDKDAMVAKLEPFLKSGLIISKALLEANVVKASFYRCYKEDENFRDKIDAYKQYLSVMVNSILFSEVQDIVRKKSDKIEINKEEREFLKWFALNNNNLKDEYGERKDIRVFDPEVEIQKIKSLLEENTTKDINDTGFKLEEGG